MESSSNYLGKMLKNRRLMMAYTLGRLATLASVSPSYLARIERGKRFPSASILKKVAKPLGFTEVELFTVAGYLPSESSDTRQNTTLGSISNIDAYVASVLASEPLTTQRAIIAILSLLKVISRKSMVQASDPVRTSN